MFLTTNRIRDFDPTFFLPHPVSTVEHSRTLENLADITESCEGLTNFAGLQVSIFSGALLLNGRQTVNLICTALSISALDGMSMFVKLLESLHRLNLRDEEAEDDGT